MTSPGSAPGVGVSGDLSLGSLTVPLPISRRGTVQVPVLNPEGRALAASVVAAQLKVDVALVNVVATVTDDKGRYIADLSADDFLVFICLAGCKPGQ